jgi:hypothetical protein
VSPTYADGKRACGHLPPNWSPAVSHAVRKNACIDAGDPDRWVAPREYRCAWRRGAALALSFQSSKSRLLARWASAARPLYEAFSVSRIELRGGPGSTRLPPGQHLGGHRLTSLYRAVSVAQRAASSTLFKYALVRATADTPKRWRGQRSRAAGERDRGRKSRRRRAVHQPYIRSGLTRTRAKMPFTAPATSTLASGRDQSTKAASRSQGRARSHVHPDTPARAGVFA